MQMRGRLQKGIKESVEESVVNNNLFCLEIVILKLVDTKSTLRFFLFSLMSKTNRKQ